MKNFDEYERQLKNNPNAKRIMAAADSEEGRRLAQTLNAEAVEKSARSGDAAALKNILTQVLSTPDGKALAKKLQDAIKGK